ncbi:ribosome small subunit-dependent GTPase A [Sorangium sp. So ce131]|uniref:ribosome small subunit-dependent GTPase A n=1 Tax=Sorangium sp. So ce131 TaxID=3133282 RepID=UPI003F605BC4
MQQQPRPDLIGLGWTPFFARQLASLGEAVQPARVLLASAAQHHVQTADGPRLAVVSGRLAHEAADRSALPTVGDWVGLRPGDGAGPAYIVHTFTRSTCLRRKAAGPTVEAQVLAANVDTVFIVTSLNADFNLRRLERYIEVVLDSGARPVIVLNKADLCPDPGWFREAAREIAPAAPIALVSALSGAGLDALRAEVGAGETVALVGSSGVGKSALSNRLLGAEVQLEGAIRATDERGRHTTAHRELFVMPGGGLLIDTPGVRELGLWSADGGALGGFDDVEALAGACRFRDCAHEGEPGCAVLRAVEDSALDPDRLGAYRKLGAERRYLAGQQDVRVRIEEKRRWKQLVKHVRAHPKR